MKKIILGLCFCVASQGWSEDLSPRTAKTVVEDGAYLVTSPLRINLFESLNYPK